MTSERDPPRLAHPLIDAGRQELPDEQQLAALAAKLGPLLGPGGGGGGGGGGAGAAGKGAGAAKAAAAAKGGVALTAMKAIAAIATVGVVGAGGAAAVVHARHVQDATNATVAATGLVAAPPSASTPADERLVLAPPPAASAARTSSHGSGASAAPADPEEEVRLLERAQDALRASPDDALRLTAEHARRFPNGTLAQEREVIAIDALVRAGHTAEAKARADKFAKTYPQSTHLRRVQLLVGE